MLAGYDMRNHVPIASCALALAGCVSHDVGPAAPPSEARSLVQLEMVYTRASAKVGLDAAAHFVRYRTTEPPLAADDAEQDKRALSSLLGLQHDDDLVAGTCRSVYQAQASSPASLSDVVLLDAGSLTVRNAGAVELVLAPQHYPELLPFVSGVVYGEEGVQTRAPLPSAPIEIEAEGGEDVGPFVAAARVPRAFPDLTVGRQEGELDLAWVAAQGAGTVLVDLRWGGAHAGSVRCRTTDEGHFSVSHASAALALRIDDALAQGSQVAVSVSRSEPAALDAPGVGAGRLLVTLRDTTILSP